MTAIDLALSQWKLDEGYRQFPYLDPKGISTVAYGRNLKSAGISQEEGEYLARNDLQAAEIACQEAISNFNSLTMPRQAALIGMAANLGRAEFGEFTQFLDYIEAGEYDKAADDLLNTLAARQNVARYQRYAAIIRNG